MLRRACAYAQARQSLHYSHKQSKLLPKFRSLTLLYMSTWVFSAKLCVHVHMSLDARKPVFGGVANNKDTDQPAHPRRLISAFVICLLESIISRFATTEISIF